jgi:hypothetical protein
MAVDEKVRLISVPANAALTNKQYKLGLINSSGKVAAVASAGGDADGVIYDEPAAADRATQLAIGDVVKARAGAAITAGAELAADADGDVVTATSTDIILGRALESAAAAGDIIKVLFVKNGVKA